MTSRARSQHPGPVAEPGASRRERLVDAALGALYAGFFLGDTVLLLRSKVLHLPWSSGPGAGSVSVNLQIELVSFASIALVLVCAVALAWRRSRPATSYLVICAAALVQVAVGEPISGWNVALPIALFSAAAYADRAFARLALGIAVVGYLGLWALQANVLGRLGSLPSLVDLLGNARVAVFMTSFAALVVIWVLGDQVRAARDRTEARLERLAQLEREREVDARIGALAERHRIARELHDVVAHGLSVMIVQADGALYAEAEHPEAPRQALATIAATGRASLAEMRHLLGVLRDDPDAAQLAPQPGLEAVPGLIERFREAGLDVDHRVEGTPHAVTPAVGLTAYRVLQESLTNVLHHVGATRVVVLVTFLPHGVAITVTNDPGRKATAPPSPGRPGLGLLGMRERVGLLGGRMAAGPTLSGGFEVRVEIPDQAPGIGWTGPGPAVAAPWGTPSGPGRDVPGAAGGPT